MDTELDEIINKVKRTDAIYNLEMQLLELRKPNVWNVYVKGNKEREMEVDFEKLLIAVQEFTNEKIDEMTVYRFYVMIEYLKEKHRNGSKTDNTI